VPASGELNWQSLSTFLIALGTTAQSTTNTKLAIRVATATPVTAVSASDTIIITQLAAPAAVAVNLPAGVLGQAFFIVDGTGDAATNNVTVDGNGSEAINGAANYVINKDRAGVLIAWNGSGWTILAEFTNIAAGTIPRSSIALGTANHVVINSGTGALSSEAALAKSRGGTGVDNSSVTFPASGTITTTANTLAVFAATTSAQLASVMSNETGSGLLVFNASPTLTTPAISSPTGLVKADVGLGNVDNTSDATKNAAAVALTNKDYDGGVASNTSRLTIPKASTATLTALTRKQATVVYDSSLNAPYYDDGSVLVPFGSGSGGGVNYITNSTFETGVTGWDTYADAAGVVPVNGTGGSPDITLTASASSPLRGTQSGILTKDGANRQGQGFSCAFTIAAADKSLPLSISWEGLASAAYTGSGGAEFLSVFVYDVTNSTLIYPSSTQVAPGATKGQCNFSATTSTSYRLIFHVAGTGTSAWTYQIDTVSVGNVSTLYGYAATDWILYPTVGTGFDANSQSVYYRQSGGDVEIRGEFTIANITGSQARLTLPAGLTVGATPATNTQVVGYMSQSSVDSRNFSTILATAGDAYLTFGIFDVTTQTNSLTSGGGTSFLNANRVSIWAKLPIATWTSNVQMANRALEEFASLASTWDASDTTATGTVSGPAGSVMGGALGAVRTKRIVWQNPRQATDNVFVEIDQLATGNWQQVPISGFADSPSSVNDFGVACKPVSGQASQTDVVFSRYRTTATTAWDSTARWRVRKVSAGALVGFQNKTERFFANTTNGIAANSVRLSNVITNSTGGLVTVASDNASTGFTVTAIQRCRVMISSSLRSSAAGTNIGLTVNGSSAGSIDDGTNNSFIQAIGGQMATGAPFNVAAAILLEVGDVLRPTHIGTGWTVAGGTFNNSVRLTFEAVP